MKTQIRKKAAVAEDVPEAPAKLHDGHRRDRLLGIAAGARKAWRNTAEHPLMLAFERGQLNRGGEAHNAKERFAAGEEYRRLYEGAQVRSRDSTQLEVVLGGSGAGLSDLRADAIRKLIAIDSHMKQADRRIVRRVCGEAWWLADAVREALGVHYAKAVVPRLNEALDALCDAVQSARKAGWKAGR